jgi:HAD superfamily hydrolase (TIGR01509 family)
LPVIDWKGTRMGKKGMILDCDGTLLDSMGAWRDIDNRLAERAGQTLTQDEKSLLNSLTVPEVCQWFHEHMALGATWEEVYGIIDDIMRDFYANECEERPGARSFVKALHEAGVGCVVVSSTAHSLLDIGLARCNMAEFIDDIVSTEDVDMSKRDPRIYAIACKRIGVAKEDTWGIDDSLYAVRAMHDAGYRTIGMFDHDDAGSFEELASVADRCIASLDDLDVAELLAAWGR